jgi:hypothetical protein
METSLPGGEVDSLRPWAQRDCANLAGCKGFVKMAIRAGVPIVPIATAGGADAMPVLILPRPNYPWNSSPTTPSTSTKRPTCLRAHGHRPAGTPTG